MITLTPEVIQRLPALREPTSGLAASLEGLIETHVYDVFQTLRPAMTLNTDTIRQELQARRTELVDRQSRVSKHTRHREEPLPADFAEQAVELENGETLVALDQEISEELARIEKALTRLEGGAYFQCERCGADIGEARLKALPGSSLCIDCASALG